jgi:hypothetical protein
LLEKLRVATEGKIQQLWMKNIALSVIWRQANLSNVNVARGTGGGLLAALVQGWLRNNLVAAIKRHIENGCNHQNQGGNDGDGLDATADQHDQIWMQALTRRGLDSGKK